MKRSCFDRHCSYLWFTETNISCLQVSSSGAEDCLRAEFCSLMLLNNILCKNESGGCIWEEGASLPHTHDARYWRLKVVMRQNKQHSSALDPNIYNSLLSLSDITRPDSSLQKWAIKDQWCESDLCLSECYSQGGDSADDLTFNCPHQGTNWTCSTPASWVKVWSVFIPTTILSCSSCRLLYNILWLSCSDHMLLFIIKAKHFY